MMGRSGKCPVNWGSLAVMHFTPTCSPSPRRYDKGTSLIRNPRRYYRGTSLIQN